MDASAPRRRRLTDPTKPKSPRPISVRKRAAAAELISLGFMTGVLRAEPATQEIAFDGLRYRWSGTRIAELIDVIGQNKLADAIGVRLHACASTVLGAVQA